MVLHGPGLDNYSSDASDWERSFGPLDSPWLGEDAAGGEARIHIHTATGLLCSLDVAKRDVDQHFWICPRDVKWAIRDKFGVPVAWQTLLHGTPTIKASRRGSTGEGSERERRDPIHYECCHKVTR